MAWDNPRRSEFETDCRDGSSRSNQKLNLIPTTNGSLLQKLGSGANDVAWPDFVAAYSPILKRWAIRANFPRSDTDDLLSEIYLHLVPRLRRLTYEPERRFRGWLKQTVLSAIANFREKKAREIGVACDTQVLSQLVATASLDSLADDLDADISKRFITAESIVAKVRSRIKPENWNAFLLTHVEGMSCDEAAQELGIDVGQVYVARCRVAAMLRRAGDSEFPDK